MNKTQGLKILKGAGLAAGGAITAYLIGELPNVDFGNNTAWIAAVISTLLNAVYQWTKQK